MPFFMLSPQLSQPDVVGASSDTLHHLPCQHDSLAPLAPFTCPIQHATFCRCTTKADYYPGEGRSQPHSPACQKRSCGPLEAARLRAGLTHQPNRGCAKPFSQLAPAVSLTNQYNCRSPLATADRQAKRASFTSPHSSCSSATTGGCPQPTTRTSLEYWVTVTRGMALLGSTHLLHNVTTFKTRRHNLPT